MKKLLNILIPTYNRTRGLQRFIALTTLYSSKYPNLDIQYWIMNDGGVDGLADLIDHPKYPLSDRFHVYYQPNCGVSIARNNLLEEVTNYYSDKTHKGWMMFYDDDDILLENFFKCFYEKTNRSDYIFNYYSYDYQLRIPTVLTKYYPYSKVILKGTEYWKEGAITGDCPSITGAVFNLDNPVILKALTKVRFKAKVNYGEDTLFLLDLIDNLPDFKVTLVPEVCAISYSGSVSLCRGNSKEEFELMVNTLADKIDKINYNTDEANRLARLYSSILRGD